MKKKPQVINSAGHQTRIRCHFFNSVVAAGVCVVIS